MKDFLLLVEEMRRAQRAYFRLRTYENLQESKRLEAEVDAWLKRHRARIRKAAVKQVFLDKESLWHGLKSMMG